MGVVLELPDKTVARLRALGQAEVAAQAAYAHAHHVLIETTTAVLETLGYDATNGTYQVDNTTGIITHIPPNDTGALPQTPEANDRNQPATEGAPY